MQTKYGRWHNSEAVLGGGPGGPDPPFLKECNKTWTKLRINNNSTNICYSHI